MSHSPNALRTARGADMNTHDTLRTALLAVLAAVALAACDRDTTSRPKTTTGTAGERIDQAIGQTQQTLAEAGEKLKPRLERAGEKIAAAAEKTGDTLVEAAQGATAGMKESARPGPGGISATTTANGATATISTGERTSITGISPETRASLDDTAITASIKAGYLKDPDLSVLRIDVDTTGGTVTLNGVADNDAARKRAEQIAASTKGVKEVRNYLTVKRG
jgi:osmotically-inducible protein OsmY